jgi:uncharacterized protein YlxW (UPF0749 family)
MRWMIRLGLGVLAWAAVAASPNSVRGADPARWTNRTDLEEHTRQLEHRVIELQHQIMAARHNHDQDGLTRAEAQLKDVQAERVEALRSLGKLP